jgi:hypothetical protein
MYLRKARYFQKHFFFFSCYKRHFKVNIRGMGGIRFPANKLRDLNIRQKEMRMCSPTEFVGFIWFRKFIPARVPVSYLDMPVVSSDRGLLNRLWFDFW